jgi:hypothetical protein
MYLNFQVDLQFLFYNDRPTQIKVCTDASKSLGHPQKHPYFSGLRSV